MSQESEDRVRKLEAISDRFQVVVKKLEEFASYEESLQARHLGGEDVSTEIAGVQQQLGLYNEEKKRLVDIARQLGWTEDLCTLGASTASEAPRKRRIVDMTAEELDDLVNQEKAKSEDSRRRVNKFMAERDPLRSHRFAEKKNKLCSDIQLIDYEICNIKERMQELYAKRARLAADVSKLEEDYRNWEPTI